ALAAGRSMRRSRQPGATRRLLPAADVPSDLAWAAPAPHIAGAIARMSAALDECARHAITPPARAALTEALERWDGADPPPGSEWIAAGTARMDGDDAAVTRLCLLVALAPFRVGESDVELFRAVHSGDCDLVAAVCWAAF